MTKDDSHPMDVVIGGVCAAIFIFLVLPEIGRALLVYLERSL